MYTQYNNSKPKSFFTKDEVAAIERWFKNNPHEQCLPKGRPISINNSDSLLIPNNIYAVKKPGNETIYVMDTRTVVSKAGMMSIVYKGVNIKDSTDNYAVKVMKQKTSQDNLNNEAKMFNVYYSSENFANQDYRAAAYELDNKQIIVESLFPAAKTDYKEKNDKLSIEKENIAPLNQVKNIVSTKLPDGTVIEDNENESGLLKDFVSYYEKFEFSNKEELKKKAEDEVASFFKNSSPSSSKDIIGFLKDKMNAYEKDKVAIEEKRQQTFSAEKDNLPNELSTNFYNEMDNLISKSINLVKAMQMGHGSGIIFRDFKPDNFIISPNGESFPIDFGSAIINDTKDQMYTKYTDTATGGTLDYMNEANRLTYEARNYYKSKYMLSEIITGFLNEIHNKNPGFFENSKDWQDLQVNNELLKDIYNTKEANIPKYSWSYNTDLYALGHSMEEMCAEALNLSPNEYGDLPKKYEANTGDTSKCEDLNKFIAITKQLKGNPQDRPSYDTIINSLQELQKNIQSNQHKFKI